MVIVAIVGVDNHQLPMLHHALHGFFIIKFGSQFSCMWLLCDTTRPELGSTEYTDFCGL